MKICITLLALVCMLVAKGNTKSDPLNGKGKLETEREKWRYLGQISALNTFNDTYTTAERYDAKVKSDYKLSD